MLQRGEWVHLVHSRVVITIWPSMNYYYHHIMHKHNISFINQCRNPQKYVRGSLVNMFYCTIENLNTNEFFIYLKSNNECLTHIGFCEEFDFIYFMSIYLDFSIDSALS